MPRSLIVHAEELGEVVAQWHGMADHTGTDECEDWEMQTDANFDLMLDGSGWMVDGMLAVSAPLCPAGQGNLSSWERRVVRV